MIRAIRTLFISSLINMDNPYQAGKIVSVICFLHIPFASLMKFWIRLRPRPLARENSAARGKEVRLRQFAFALRDAALCLRRSAPKTFEAPKCFSELPFVR